MSLGNWLARRGGIGGTARWSVKLYKHHSKEDTSLSEIMKAMVFTRYKATLQLKSKAHILEKIYKLIESSEICDLHTLSLYLISEESKHFFEIPREKLVVWSEITLEELIKSGLPNEVICEELDETGDTNEVYHDWVISQLFSNNHPLL